MKVVIINRSDSIGGAAIASHRLLHALIDEGVEAHMLVIDKQLTDDPAVMAVGNGLKNKWNFLAERMGIALRTGFDRDTLFKIDPATHGLNLSRHPLVKDAD
ncbi:MAG: glycosyl transferase, partial [Muribaculaceae bacterium]|nr:glycosyl transferase [Muribaculaceae bacterium]